MMIERLNGANPVASIQKSLIRDTGSSCNPCDSVTVSKEAEKFAEEEKKEAVPVQTSSDENAPYIIAATA